MKIRIQGLANLPQRSGHLLMRETTTQFLEREEARDNFKQEALASWAAYQKSGKHSTGQETRAWLESWGTDAGRELPKSQD